MTAQMVKQCLVWQLTNPQSPRSKPSKNSLRPFPLSLYDPRPPELLAICSSPRIGSESLETLTPQIPSLGVVWDASRIPASRTLSLVCVGYEHGAPRSTLSP